MGLRYFPPVNSIPLGSGLAVDADGKLEATGGAGGGGGGVSSITAGTGLTGGTITSSGTIAASFGTTAGTICQGNDSRLSDARTPTSHTHAASDIASGTIASARLGTGTADATTFLRGDGSWATPTGGGGGGSSILHAPSITIPSGSYRSLASHYSPSNTTAFGSNVLKLVPFIQQKTETFSAIGVQVTSASATGLLHLAIYGSDANGFPTGVPIVSVTGMSASTTGMKEGGSSFTLTAGVQYWTAQLATVASVVVRGNGTTAVPILYLDIQTATTMSYRNWLQKTATSLPSPISGPFLATTGNYPIVFAKA